MQDVPTNQTIGKCKNGAYTQAEITFKPTKEDTVFRFTYLNAKYSTLNDYQTITFNSEGNTLSSFYSVLKDMFSKQKGSEQSFKLGDTDVIVSNKKNMGVTALLIYTPNGYVYLTEKQVDKTFGR
jgi:hypothetical protein